MSEQEKSFSKLVKALPNYEYRKQQEDMANLIANSLRKKQHAIVEAGTGCGKSFAYLYPVIESGKTTVISTGTIALQEQILEKDIPFIQQAGWKNLKAVIAKGRTNYVCKQKLYDLERTILPGTEISINIQDLISELNYTWDGDFSNLPFKIDSDIKKEIASTPDDCFYGKCEFLKNNEAPFYQARGRLAKADIIVTNHALYFADIISGGNVLPDHDYVVFDEAHHLYNIAIKAFTVRIGRYSSTKILQKIEKRISKIPQGFISHLFNCEAELMEWIFKFDKSPKKLKKEDTKHLNKFIAMSAKIIDAIKDIEEWLNFVPINESLFPEEVLKLKATINKQNLLNQVKSLRKKWEFFVNDDSYIDRVNWIEIDLHRAFFEIKSAPLFIESFLKNTLWEAKTCILTSATITTNNDFKYIKSQLGIESANELQLSSPFDYNKNVALYIPRNHTPPTDRYFLRESKDLIVKTMILTQGRSFLLFSSWKNMTMAFELLKKDLENLDFPIKKQGDLPRKKLIEWFKLTSNSILFATATFWEGIDIPGSDLSCVLIDKLPFSVPDDPVVESKVDYMKANGINWFNEYMLPEAIIKLRQGVGRLIRTKKDKGLLVILDNRIHTKFYGKKIIKSLPPVTQINDLQQSLEFISDD